MEQSKTDSAPKFKLRDQAQLVGWQTSGLIPSSSPAPMENTGECRVSLKLNPRFSLWLMGYEIAWAFSGERVTR
jgi:hypothetical protein